MANRNLPYIRFKDYSTKWSLETLTNCCSLITKQTGFDYSETIKPSLLTKKEKNSLSFIQNKDFEGKNINYNTDFYIPQKIADRFPKITLNQPCLLVTISGKIGNVGYYANQEKAFIGGAVGICKLKKDTNGEFLLYELMSDYGKRHFNSLVKASSHANITVNDIRQIPVYIPSSSEQTRIASLFTALDKQISCSEAKLDKLRTIKKTLLKKMFASQGEKTPQIRFKGFDGEWEEKKLGEICSVNRGVRVTRKDLNEQGKYPVFQNTDYPMGYFSKCNVEENNPFVIIGGSAGLIGFCKEKFWAADDCAYFGDSKEIEKIFLFSLLLNNALFIKKNIRGSSVPRLDRKVLIEMQVQLPTQDISEQTRIASLFTALDKQISCQEKKIEKLKAVKKTLLKKMFV